MCVCVCVVLRSLITPRWILISVWWDTKHQSQATNALAANHFNEYILFWPLSELVFVFLINFPLPYYALSVLGLFYIHTLPFKSLSQPFLLLYLSSFRYFSLTHPSFWFFLKFISNIFHPLSSFPFLLTAVHHIHSSNQENVLEAGVDVPLLTTCPGPECQLEIPEW